ncbi:uncharacterized protein LOC130136750 [Syzygium oleosum]|uniref:uncharacterized protein LOC130136750 n=1 Tax=Syzygium oleosum TaxID=219896 RepID=UPI0024BA8604|nr:uncharacterized protein LOC130136750 [Syzygium oleosum]
MSGGGESAATRCSTCVVGTPVEPRAHPANQHAATWIAGEARLASFPSSYLNATPSGSASGSGIGAARTRLSGRSPTNKICDVLDRCGKRFEDAMRKAEALADNVWPLCEFSLHFVSLNMSV